MYGMAAKTSNNRLPIMCRTLCGLQKNTISPNGENALCQGCELSIESNISDESEHNV